MEERELEEGKLVEKGEEAEGDRETVLKKIIDFREEKNNSTNWFPITK